MNIAKIKLIHRALKYRYLDDKQEISYLLKHIKNGDTVLDIGAHKGGYTYWMQRAVGKTGKVVAFEPQQSGAQLLRSLFPHITIEEKAVSSVSGEKTLHVQPQTYDVSFEASLHQQYPNGQEKLVVTTTIDDYCSQHALQPSFIKIDVEGHELDVIRGAAEVLRANRPVLLIEAEERHIGIVGLHELFARLLSARYKGSFFYLGQQVPIADFQAHIHQTQHALQSEPEAYANNFMFEWGR